MKLSCFDLTELKLTCLFILIQFVFIILLAEFVQLTWFSGHDFVWCQSTFGGQNVNFQARHFCVHTCSIEYFIFLVRTVRKDEKRYYMDMLQYSQDHLMLYPYHLSDIVVKGLRVTPFVYYSNMMSDIMTQEKSYDSLPNFTAADCKFCYIFYNFRKQSLLLDT